MNKWTTWFAWYPVRTLGGRLVWMREVQRRPVSPERLCGCGCTDGSWEYRLPAVGFFVYAPGALKLRLEINHRKKWQV